MHAAYPDFGDVLMDAITAGISVPAGTSLPASLGPGLGQTGRFVLVEVIGGPSGPLEARPAIDLSVIATSYKDASETARTLEAWLTTPGGRRLVHSVTGVITVVDEAEVQIWREVPWKDSLMRQVMTTATLTFRRGTGVTSGPAQADPELEGFFLGGGGFVPDPSNDGFFLGRA